MHTSSLQVLKLVLKRHRAAHQVRHTDSVTGCVCWRSILLLLYSMSDLCTVRCTSLGGPRPMVDLRSWGGHMTSSLTSPAEATVCTSLFLFTQNIYPLADIMPYDE